MGSDPATFPGLKRLLLPRRSERGDGNIAAIRAQALFQPPDTTVPGGRRSLIQFLRGERTVGMEDPVILDCGIGFPHTGIRISR